MSHTVPHARADGRGGNGDRIGRSRTGGGSTTVPRRIWTPEDEYAEPSMMVGTAQAMTDEEPSGLVLPDGTPVPRRRVGFRPPGER